MFRDVLHACWQLRRRPTTAAACVILLGLGIGISATLFATLYAVLLRPLPFRASDQLVSIGFANQSDNRHPGTTSLAAINNWRAQNHTLQNIAAWSLSVKSSSQPAPERIVTVECSANLFSLLGVVPVRGRGFLPNEDAVGADHVAILSGRVWHDVFASDPNAVGRAIQLGNVSYRVVGIMDRRFKFPLTGDDPIIWIPGEPTPSREDRNLAMLSAIGRLKPGISAIGTSHDLNSIQSATASAGSARQRVVVESYRERITGAVRKPLFSIAAAALAIWLLAFLNVATLLLSYFIARRGEIAIRTALGATVPALLRQFIAEAVMLGLMAAGCGAVLSLLFIRILRTYIQGQLPFGDQIRITWPILSALTLVSLLSMIVAAGIPAVNVYLTTPRNTLQEGTQRAGSSKRYQRLRDYMVIGEVALSLALLSAGGLLFRTLDELHSVSLGFEPSHLIVGQLNLSQEKNRTHDLVQGVYEPLLRDLGRLPGVESAAIANVLPLSGDSTVKMMVQSPTMHSSASASMAELRIVSQAFYRTLHVQVLRGRSFTSADSTHAPRVAVVNEAFARKYFRAVNPIGQQLRINEDGPNKYATVIGIVADTHQTSLKDSVQPEIDLSLEQVTPQDDVSSMLGFIADVAIKSQAPSATIEPEIADVLGHVNADSALYDIFTMRQVIDRSIARQTLLARLLWIFAASGLFIASCGLYASLTHRIATKTRDIGIQMALGAQRSAIASSVVRHALKVLLAGIVLGLVISIIGARLLNSFLFGIGEHDPITLLCVSMLLLGAGGIAAYIPTRRAVALDPMAALRHE